MVKNKDLEEEIVNEINNNQNDTIDYVFECPLKCCQDYKKNPICSTHAHTICGNYEHEKEVSDFWSRIEIEKRRTDYEI